MRYCLKAVTLNQGYRYRGNQVVMGQNCYTVRLQFQVYNWHNIFLR